MKKILLLISMFLSIAAYAQYNQNAPWMKELNNKEKRTGQKPTFQEVQQAFNQYWLTHDKDEKGSGYKPFKRFENIWKSRVDENGYLPTAQDQINAWQQKKAFGKSNRMADASNWQAFGPFSYNQANAQPAGLGRVNGIAVDSNNPNTWYVGSPGGGVWKTTDAAATWAALSDNLPRAGVSAIAIDYNNSDIIYIATGDDDGGGRAISIGVYKSIDGGVTWNVTGLDVPFLNGTTKLSEIFIDPTDSNKLICSGEDGVYRTTDAGVTWTKTLVGENIRDMRLKPGDAQTVYAVSPTAFYKSTDGGANFTQITNGVPSDVRRMVIDVTPANPDYVYIFSQSETNYWEHGIFRSTNSGNSFTTRNIDTYDLIGNGQIWYNMAMAVSDTNANELYVGTLDVHKSTNGGQFWSKLNRWDQLTDNYTHADIHSLRFYNGRLFCASDGGIYSSTNKGVNFTDHTEGLQIGEFYRVSVAQNNANNVAGGLQDNGGFGLGVNGDWRGYHPGDGINALIPSNDDNRYYGMIQNGDRLYISNQADGFIDWVSKPSNAGTGVWQTPIASDSNGEVYAAWSRLFKLNRNTNTWETVGETITGYTDELEIAPSDPLRIVSSGHQNLRVSSDGGLTYDFNTNVVGNAISDITIDQNNADIMWISTDGGNAGRGVWKTIDGGYNWTDITGNLPAGEFPNAIVHQGGHPLNPVFVATDLGVYRLDDSSPDWVPFFNNLPNVDIRDLSINLNDQSITAATYGRGLWRSSIPVQLLPNDASLLAINKPTNQGASCGNIDPQIRVRSNGINDITEINISYGAVGEAPSNYTWNGTLTSNEETIIDLPGISYPSGTYTLEVQITINNDGNLSNNTRTQDFSINESGFLNEVNSFESASDALIVENGVWEFGVPTGSVLNTTGTGTQVYGTNLSGNYPTDVNANLMSHCFDFTTIVNPVLKFKMAYQLEQNWDWSNVQYSLDGAQSWNNLGSVNSQPNWYNSNRPDASDCPGCPGAQWTGTNATMTEYAYDFVANAAAGEADLTNEGNIVFRITLHSDSVITEEGIIIDDFVVEGAQVVSKINPKIFLQGPLLNPNTGEENLMRDDLRIAGVIPTTSPYSDRITCDVSVFNDGGTSGVGAINDNIVDWVFLELRDASNNNIVRVSQSALLQRDGDVVDVDGVSNLEFNVANANYYILIKHRNHLPVMTSTTLSLDDNAQVVNFTDVNNPITFGTNAQTSFGMPSNIMAMWAGDVNGDAIVQYSGTAPDSPSILSEVLNDAGNFLNFPTYTVTGYNIHDVNMDGKIQYAGTNPDTPFILQNVLAHPANFLNFSTYQIEKQLPNN